MDIGLLTRAIYPLHGYGGMERHCYDWIRAMVRLGCRLHVFTMPPQDPSRLSEFPGEVFFSFLPGKPARSVIHRITTYPSWVRRIHQHLLTYLRNTPLIGIYAHGLAAAACGDLKTPFLYNPHGMEEFKCYGLKYLAYAPFRALSRKAASFSTRIIATDPSLVLEIVEFFGVKREKIILLPNAVEEMQPVNQEKAIAFAKQLNLLDAKPLLLSTGRHEKNKGFDILLKALSRCPHLPPDWKLVLAGSGSQTAVLQWLAVRLGLAERVVFPGILTDEELQILYHIADLFIHPTLYEGSSLVTLEAMRAGLPVIATQTGGLPDKIVPDYNGWLVAPGDINALAATIQQACKKMEDWPIMGQHSIMIIEERYSWNKIAPQFLALFQNRFSV